jgi:hypothetical protein
MDGSNGRQEYQLTSLYKKVRAALTAIAPQEAQSAPPPVVLNKHCAECQYAPHCGAVAKNADDLSLLSKMSQSVPGGSKRIAGTPRWTGLSTNATCQPEKPENSQVKTRGAASTSGLSLHPQGASPPTGENPQHARMRAMLGIWARETAGAAVNKRQAWSWGRKVLAPQKTWFPTTSPPFKTRSGFEFPTVHQ